MGTINMTGHNIKNLRFAEDIDCLAVSEQEWRSAPKKTKLMTNNIAAFTNDIKGIFFTKASV